MIAYVEPNGVSIGDDNGAYLASIFCGESLIRFEIASAIRAQTDQQPLVDELVDALDPVTGQDQGRVESIVRPILKKYARVAP